MGHIITGLLRDLPELRQSIADDITKRRGVPVKASEVVVTPGAKPIIFFTALALLDPGDEAIYPNPGFPIYESMINYVGAKAVPVPLREDQNWSLDVDEFARSLTPKTKLVILNSPHNPTGGVIPAEGLHRIAELALRYDFTILSDEIYCRVLYSGEYHSIFSLPGMKDRTILLDGFSKIYAMTGWRLGYGIMREDLAQQISKLQTNATSCTASFTQIAGVEALTGDQSKPDEMVEEFRKRRDLMVAGLNEIPGISCKTPDGAFYVFPNVRKLGLPSKKLADFCWKKPELLVFQELHSVHGAKGISDFRMQIHKKSLREALKRVKTLVTNSKLVPI